MSQTTKSPRRSAALTLLMAVILVGLCGYSLADPTESAPNLDQVLEERDRGRSFYALDLLNSLSLESPDSSRLKVETAVLHIQLKDYATADKLLTEVLSGTDLPAPVRVNVQLLQLKTRRLLDQQQSNAFSLQMEGGAAYSSGPNQSQWLFDSQMSAQHRRALPTLNVHGYPVFNHWINQAEVLLKSPDHSSTEHNSTEISAQLSTGLELQLLSHRLTASIDTGLTEHGPEQGWSLGAQWQPEPVFRLTGYLAQSWLTSGDTEQRRQVAVRLFNDQPLQLTVSYRYNAINGDDPAATHRLGAELGYKTAGYWALGSTYRLDGPATKAKTALYLYRDHPLSHGFGLIAELRYQDYDNNNATGYGRLGVRWRK